MERCCQHREGENLRDLESRVQEPSNVMAEWSTMALLCPTYSRQIAVALGQAPEKVSRLDVC